VHTRSGVSQRPVVKTGQTGRGQAFERRSSATLTKGRTWPSAKQRLRRGGNPVASALYHGRANYRLRWKRSQGPIIAQECYCGALRAAILSGFPTITTLSFSQCPASGPIPFVGRPDRRPRQIPLARGDIPGISQLMSATPSSGPDVISQLRSLSPLLKSVVQYDACRENTCLVGPGRRSGRKADSTRCEISRP
jgi:hypothetical protein